MFTMMKLFLQSNQIYKIQLNTFSGLRRLQELNLNNNQLTGIRHESFTGLERLEILCLQNNLLSQAPSLTLLTSLKTLDISSNNLTKLLPHTFSDLSHLSDLSINNNQLVNISSDAFLGLTQMQTLRLDSNRLQTLGNDCILRVLKSLSSLSLLRNPLSCDCRQAWLAPMMKRSAEIKGHCASPMTASSFQLTHVNFTSCVNFHCGDI